MMNSHNNINLNSDATDEIESEFELFNQFLKSTIKEYDRHGDCIFEHKVRDLLRSHGRVKFIEIDYLADDSPNASKMFELIEEELFEMLTDIELIHESWERAKAKHLEKGQGQPAENVMQ